MLAALVPPHVQSVIDADGAVLLDLRRGKYFSLNEVGAVIWLQITNRADLDAIVSLLSKCYGIDSDIAAEDVHGFILSLCASELLLPAGDLS